MLVIGASSNDLGRQITNLHDVLFVLKLAHNLLSIGQPMSSGLVIIFDDGYCYIQDKRSGQRIAKIGMTTSRMFPLDVSLGKEKVMVVKAWKDSHIWHLLYGHLHLNGMKLLKSKDMSGRASRHLELVHADLCGPMITESLNDETPTLDIEPILEPLSPAYNSPRSPKSPSSSSSSSNDASSSDSPPPKSRDLKDIYDSCQFALYVSDPINYDEATTNQFDVKSAFLTGDLDEEVYVSQPQGIVIGHTENKSYKLNKALYRLKQAPL
ncbi:retrovirus-related pol polyprotein from transposon TNT 1-94 [Tanacetum coccineum]|uniref:Retrovirus-related pol polyprotein from transposon TNT 1-94 n=1 Tax=Tanacetum coccineum TaxID=301880 RepID=A0ABQ5A2J6_9ASTR